MRLLKAEQVIFDRYRVDARVGIGGQCFGFRGTDLLAHAKRPWEQTVFVKQYRDRDVLPGSPEAMALEGHFQTLRERLKKRIYYLCRPIHIGIANNSVVGIFEYVHGRSLEDWMKAELSTEQRTRFALAITNAIRILHKAGIAHLDLKPSNILVEEKQRTGQAFVRIIDIDASRIDGVGLRRRNLGTLNYQSPEHLWPNPDNDVSERSDVFTLGIMLFQLLFNRHPFPGTDYSIAVQNGAVEIPQNRYHCSVVERIVSCLTIDPQRRPKAGRVHSTLHEHSGTNFEAIDKKDYWVSGCVSIESVDFLRTYYYGIHLGQRNFRGSGIPGLPSQFLRLYLTVKQVLVELTNAGVDVLVSGEILEKGSPKPLRTGDCLTINGKRFSVNVCI